jgi:hypothetical protein
MRTRLSAVVLAISFGLAATVVAEGSTTIRSYAEDILDARSGGAGSDYTSVEVLEKRLSKLWIPTKYGYRAPRKSPLDETYRTFHSHALDGGFSDRMSMTGRLADIPDMLVNEEIYTSTFNQSEPSVCLLADLCFVTVWEDERNGDIDIFAQKYTFGGNPVGTNVEVGEEDFPRDQYLPRISLVDDTSFVVVWIDGESFDIYGKKFTKDLVPLGTAFQISDSPTPYTTWSPAVSFGPDGKFVVVWADTRSGNHIYARRFDLDGSPLGAGFKVSSDDGSKLHVSPEVSVGWSGNFVVVWEDFRNNDADIYVQRYDSDGNKLEDNLLVNVDSLAEDQYAPSVSVGVNDRFMVTWVDLRRGEEVVFARSLSFADPAADTVLFAVSSDTSSVTQESPPTVSDTLGRFTIAWTEYTLPNPTIYAQRYDSLGQMLGDTVTVSSLQFISERHGLSVSGSPGGSFVGAWMDKPAGNFDVYAQRVNSFGFPQGGNLLLNDDDLGANQDFPQIMVKSDGSFVVVWEDMRRSSSDIFMKRFDDQAQALGDDLMVNDSLGRVYHGRPDVAADSSGNFVVAWEDARESPLGIYAQLFDLPGAPQGENFKVDCQGMGSSTSPCCDMFAAGNFVVVWSSVAGSARDVYGRLFSSEGEPLDTCFRINDDTLDVDQLSPRVAVDSSGGFVVAWQDKREGQDKLYLQRFDSDGSKTDTNFVVYSDRVGVAQYSPDIDVGPDGDFVVSWVEPYLSSTMVFAQRYDGSGMPVDTNIVIVDHPSASPANPKVKLSDDGRFVVAWEDLRNLSSDVYFQTFLAGLPEGSNRRLNTDPDQALQFFPDIGLLNPYLYSVWTDNRLAGLGFSIFFNQVNYLESGVDDEGDQSNLPVSFVLSQNYPNPFNPSTTIRYRVHPGLIRGSNHTPVHITLAVYNVLGRKVRTLVDQDRLAGTYRITWDGRDDDGMKVCSGVYFCRLEVQDQAWTRKMLLLK